MTQSGDFSEYKCGIGVEGNNLIYKCRTVLFAVIVFSIILNVLFIGGAACEQLAPIQIENKTSEILTVYIDEYRIGDVEPNDKIKNNLVFYGHDWYLIEAYNTQGNAVYSHKFSYEEMKKINWKVVIPPLQNKQPEN